jgi:hypothetical protein
MSSKEETKTTQDQFNQEEDKESHSAPYQFYVNVNDIRDNKLNKTENSTFNRDGCLGWCLGLCIGAFGAVAYMQSTMAFIALLPFLHNWWLVIFVVALGPVLAFLCAKKVKYIALFWGFLLPYILLLLLFGACYQLAPTLFQH